MNVPLQSKRRHSDMDLDYTLLQLKKQKTLSVNKLASKLRTEQVNAVDSLLFLYFL